MLLLFVPADLRPCFFYSFSQLLCFLVRKLAEIRKLEYVGSTEKEKNEELVCNLCIYMAMVTAVQAPEQEGRKMQCSA